MPVGTRIARLLIVAAAAGTREALGVAPSPITVDGCERGAERRGCHVDEFVADLDTLRARRFQESSS